MGGFAGDPDAPSGGVPSMGFDGPCGDYDFDGFMGDATVGPSAHSVGNPGSPGVGMPVKIQKVKFGRF